MAVEFFSWPNLHERMCLTWGIELGAACMPSGHVSDRATASGKFRPRSRFHGLVVSLTLNSNTTTCFLLEPFYFAPKANSACQVKQDVNNENPNCVMKPFPLSNQTSPYSRKCISSVTVGLRLSFLPTSSLVFIKNLVSNHVSYIIYRFTIKPRHEKTFPDGVFKDPNWPAQP